jgi:crotonobetainyl-CoA:carnitine CoA-transferase CaiB-like acyl-CoA transferase
MDLKAYDLLVQAESGLVSVSGAPGEWGRVGVSVCDVTAGMNALIGIQQALIKRAQTGQGSRVKASLFGSAAELMSVPYLQTRYGGKAPQRVGLKHPSIAPYGAFTSLDAKDIVISIQNEREWADFCTIVLLKPELLEDPRCKGNANRVQNREFVDAAVSETFNALASQTIIERLKKAQTAFGRVNSVEDLINHPQLRTRTMVVNSTAVEVPALGWSVEWESGTYPSAPLIDEHGKALRDEFK